MTTANTFTLLEIQAIPAHKLILVIEGGVYDVSEFVDVHPGGREVLEHYNRQDATEAFHRISHSAAAEQMLGNYCIGVLESAEAAHTRFAERTASEQSASLLEKLQQKLITHEDRFHTHKILGGLVLSHFVVRLLIMAAGTVVFLATGSEEVFQLNYALEPAWLMVGLALLHGLLSLTSLQFAVPKKSNQSKPMIHQLFRAHSITFALRAVACMLLCVLLQDFPEWQFFAVSLVILSALIGADVITERLTDEDDRYHTTSSMPYWLGCSVRRQRSYKLLYGFAQFLATVICLFGGYFGAWLTLPAIQGAAFLMTLVRKNLISTYAYHQIYLALLYFPVLFFVFVYPVTIVFMFVVAGLLFVLRLQGVNKYLLWLPLLLAVNAGFLPEAQQSLYLALEGALALLAIAANLLQIKLKRQERADHNHRVISKRRIHDQAFEMTVRTKTPVAVKPGQHFLIRLADGLERKYTPVEAIASGHSDQTLLRFYIKEYPPVSGPTLSSYLARCDAGSVLDLHGPLGDRYLCADSLSLVNQANQQRWPIAQHRVVMLAAGSGITPLFPMAQNLCEQNQKVTLITCDQSRDTQIMGPEIQGLKQRFQQALEWVCVFSGEAAAEAAHSDARDHAQNHAQSSADQTYQQRLGPEMLSQMIPESSGHARALVLICGPNPWQSMIKQAFFGREDVELLVW